MKVTSGNMNIAEYCHQYDSGHIAVNRIYQRSDRIWPPQARSYLIDTILSGYPIPKISLSQKTDLMTRKTVKEIVDGQQRTRAILDFYHDKLTITTPHSEFAGKKYSTLPHEFKQKFVEYDLGVDVFAGASEWEIREAFRRMNSYTVPLNNQEKRHATYQGPFKWFINKMADRYSSSFKKSGVLSDAQLSRMQDSELLTELSIFIEKGIQDSSQARLDSFYSEHEKHFENEAFVEEVIDFSIGYINELRDIHNTSIMTKYNYYSLFSAVSHAKFNFEHSRQYFSFDVGVDLLKTASVVENLTILADAISNKEEVNHGYDEFVKACTATTRMAQRKIRFVWLCKALLPGGL